MTVSIKNIVSLLALGIILYSTQPAQAEFGDGGKVTTAILAANESASSVAMQSDGKIVELDIGAYRT
jgi:hypothetical protein